MAGSGTGEAVDGGVGAAAPSVLLTGSSGFLGKVVLGRLLACGGDFAKLLLLLRADDAEAALRRVREEIVGSEALGAEGSALLEEGLASGRIGVTAADLSLDGLGGSGRAGWGEVDTVVHCAATVSFEEPLDRAIETNALGPVRLLDAVREAGAEPHFVHVSTAYAAECRTDVVSEAEYAHPAVAGLDLGETLEASRWWRQTAEAESREPGRARKFATAAGRDAATRSGVDPEARAEALRMRWVTHRLSELGRREAIKAGWPDTYALTKALGERLLAESCERLTIVRPSIIESSLLQPRPGWLEGIKVADPLILAYAGRGLTHLPARRTNLIDIVPVDCVANACLAAALYPPDGASPRVLAVASTARNPLEIGGLGDHVRAYFSREPLRRGSGEVQIGELRYVARGTALRAVARRRRLAAAGARAAAAPFVPRATEAKLRRLESLAGQIARMVRIYAPYTELNCVFDDSNLSALGERMSPRHRAELPFDTAAFEWTDYLESIHLPELRRMANEAG
jgi:nucleoside-diphosphate-sugar epimerase